MDTNKNKNEKTLIEIVTDTKTIKLFILIIGISLILIIFWNINKFLFGGKAPVVVNEPIILDAKPPILPSKPTVVDVKPVADTKPLETVVDIKPTVDTKPLEVELTNPEIYALVDKVRSKVYANRKYYSNDSVTASKQSSEDFEKYFNELIPPKYHSVARAYFEEGLEPAFQIASMALQCTLLRSSKSKELTEHSDKLLHAKLPISQAVSMMNLVRKTYGVLPCFDELGDACSSTLEYYNAGKISVQQLINKIEEIKRNIEHTEQQIRIVITEGVIVCETTSSLSEKIISLSNWSFAKLCFTL
jgi:hypothetical protein